MHIYFFAKHEVTKPSESKDNQVPSLKSLHFALECSL